MCGRLILWSVFFALFVVIGTIHAADNETKRSISIEGHFDPLKALKLLYGTLTPSEEEGNDEPVIWQNVRVPEPLANYFDSMPRGKVSVIFDAPFRQNNFEKHMIITATVPAGEHYECHACAPLIGGAVFRRSGRRWVLEADNKYITVTGKFGSTDREVIRFAKIGPSRYGVIFQGDDVHQGYISNYVSLIVPYGKSLVQALEFFVEGPGDAACPDNAGEDFGNFEEPGIDVRYVKGESQTSYYDIETIVRYNSGPCGQVKAVKEVRYFRFIDGKYERIK